MNASATFARPNGRYTAWALLVATVLILIVHLPLLPGYYQWVQVGRDVPYPPEIVLLIDLLDILYTGGIAALGAVIVTNQPHNRIGWLVLVIGLGSAALRLSGHYAVTALLIDTGGDPGAVRLPLADFAAWLQNWLWIPITSLEGIAVPLLFPSGRLPARRWWFFVVPVAAWILLGTFVMAFHPWIPLENYFLGTGVSLPNPYGSDAVRAFFEPIFLTLAPIFFSSVQLCIVIAGALLLTRYRHADPILRQQIKWFAFALIVTGALFILRNNVGSLFIATGFPALVEIAFLTVTSSLPIILGIAIFQYRLWEIDTLINRTLVYTILTLIIIILYVLIVATMTSVLRTNATLPGTVLTAGIVAVSFQGLRGGIQRGVNRLMFGQRDEPLRVLERLGRQLQSAVTPEDLLDNTVQTVSTALKIPYAAIHIRRVQGEMLQAEYGLSKTPMIDFPLIYQNERVGTLVIGQRSPGETLSSADQTVLDNIAQQMSAVVHSVRLLAELQRSRERLVTAREEERRRLRRDLHDGLGPALASQTLKIDAALDLLTVDPAEASSLLTDIKTRSQTLVADVRRLVYELRPPALDEIGLVGALSSAVAQMRSTEKGLNINIETPQTLPELPAAVEVAVYRITMEAVTNVVKHAEARHCTVKIALLEKPAQLQLVIEDDGKGLPIPVTSGIGLQSIRERAEELGGTFAVTSGEPAGAKVEVTMPLQQERTQ